MRPQTARAAHGVALAVSVAAIFAPTSVGTQNGEVPFVIVMPAVAAFFGLRLAGVQLQIARGLGRMPSTWRAGSWVAFAGVLFILGLFNGIVGPAAVAVFALADAAGAAAAPEADRGERARPESVLSRLAGARAPLLAALAAATVPAFHFLVARYFAFAYLLDWAYAALLAAGALRLLAGRGERLSWEGAAPPRHHRLHRRVERPVPDPMRTHMQGAVNTFLKGGDAGALLEAARDAARLARLTPDETKQMEDRVLAALARAGTSREADLGEALRVLDESLSQTGRTVISA